MTEKQADSRGGRGMRWSLNGRILRSATLDILILAVTSCTTMSLFMQSLANNILPDSFRLKRLCPAFIC